jgi:hypothetical protein
MDGLIDLGKSLDDPIDVAVDPQGGAAGDRQGVIGGNGSLVLDDPLWNLCSPSR